MRTPIAILLIAIGVTLLYFGMAANESIQSALTRLLNGLPTEHSQWLMLSGVVAIALGAGVFLRRTVA